MIKHRVKVWLALLCLAFFLSGCAAKSQLIPPMVTLRDIANMERIAKGETIQIEENMWLFVPEGYRVPETGEIRLTVHFHGTPWFVKEEHARRGAKNPLLIHGGLQGSSAYQKPFLDRSLFARLIKEVEARFMKQVPSLNPHVVEVEVSSFSAGYGAVREILKSPEHVDMIQTLILADSLYASFAEPGGGENRRPLPEHMAPFIVFARLAAKGEKIFLMSHCGFITKDYASTVDTAKALVEGVGGKFTPVKPGSIPSAAADLDYPLLYRYDQGGLHIWGYGGEDPKAHMAQARALADFWQTIERDSK